MAYLAKTIPHTIFPIMGMPETHSSRSSPTVPVRGKCDGGNKNAATGKSANIIKWWRGEPNDEEATKQIHHLQKPKKSFLKTKANPSPIILTKIGTGNACCKREVSTPVTEIGEAATKESEVECRNQHPHHPHPHTWCAVWGGVWGLHAATENEELNKLALTWFPNPS